MFGMPKKRKPPEWRSIKVRSDVYERLRAQQARISRDGLDSWGFPCWKKGEASANAAAVSAAGNTLSAVIDNALAVTQRMMDATKEKHT